MKKPTLTSNLNVILLNNVTLTNLRKDKYVIYLHECINGLYVGQSDDMVRRWRQHNEAAFNQNHRDHHQKFKIYIRNFGFKHYIIATAKTESEALEKEADAIQFYHANLNSKNEKRSGKYTDSFKPLSLQLIALKTVIQQKGTTQSFAHTDNDRETIIAKIIFDKGRKRVISVSGPFGPGLFVECAKSEREKFMAGDLVKIKVTKSNFKRGHNHYLIAAKTSLLINA